MFDQHAQTIECDNEALWLAERRKGIGASESPVLFGPEVCQWGSPSALHYDKTGQAPNHVTESDAMKWGRYLEDPIATAYAVETGRKLVNLGRNTLLRSKRLPFMQATLDRVIVDDARGTGVLEIKTVGAHGLDEWVERPPLRYQVQLQHQLSVTGAAWGALAVLVGGQKLIRFDVDRDEAFIRMLEDICAEFWHGVETNQPPQVDGTEATTKALAQLHAKDNGQTIELPSKFAKLDDELQSIKERIVKLESRERAIKNELIDAIGPASRAVIVNGPTYTYKLVEKAAYTVKPQSFRQLRRLEAK